MNDNTNTSQEINLLDIFNLLKKKVKTIVSVMLIALILGGAAGGAFSLLSNAIYGTKAQFYVYSEKNNDFVLSLVRSDAFAELLLLDENGLPADKKGTDEYNGILDMQEVMDELKKEKEEAEIELEKYPTLLNNKNRAYQDALSRYSNVYDAMMMYVMTPNSSSYVDQITALEKQLVPLTAERDAKKAEYEAALIESQNLEDKIRSLALDIKKQKSEIDDAKALILVDFRNDEDNLDNIEKVKKSVTYEYAQSDDTSSQALLNVNIAVRFDQAFAENLLSNISMKLSDYVEDTVVSEGEDARETECVFISVAGKVGSVDYKNPLIEAFKFGVLGCIGGAAIAVVTVVCIEIIKNSGAAKKEETSLVEEDSKEN